MVMEDAPRTLDGLLQFENSPKMDDNSWMVYWKISPKKNGGRLGVRPGHHQAQKMLSPKLASLLCGPLLSAARGQKITSQINSINQLYKSTL